MSTPNWKMPVTPSFCSRVRTPLERRATYMPPLPSGASASSPGAESMSLPSSVKHGHVPWLKKITWSLGSPKLSCLVMDRARGRARDRFKVRVRVRGEGEG